MRLQNSNKNHSSVYPRLALVDDDTLFGSIMQKTAFHLGYALDYYSCLSDLDFISQLAGYDIILVDFQMDHANGLEIAAYMPNFISNRVVVLVSNTELGELFGPHFPEYITEFIHKSNGTSKIIQRSVAIYVAQSPP